MNFALRVRDEYGSLHEQTGDFGDLAAARAAAFLFVGSLVSGSGVKVDRLTIQIDGPDAATSDKFLVRRVKSDDEDAGSESESEAHPS